MNSFPESDKSCEACEFQENLSILRQVPFFSALPLSALKVLAYLSAREAFKPGEYLFRTDDDDGCAFSILSGKVAMVHSDNGEETPIRTFEAGDFIGGLSLLGSMRRLFSVRAEEKTDCLVISRSKFQKAMEQFPEMLPRVLKSVVESVREWDGRHFSEHAKDCGKCRENAGVSIL